MGVFRRPVTAIWPDFGRISEIAEIRLRGAVSPFCCAFAAAVLPARYFANFSRISDFSQNILTSPYDSQNWHFPVRRYRDLGRFRPHFGDSRIDFARPFRRFVARLRQPFFLRDISHIASRPFSQKRPEGGVLCRIRC